MFRGASDCGDSVHQTFSFINYSTCSFVYSFTGLRTDAAFREKNVEKSYYFQVRPREDFLKQTFDLGEE